MEESGGSKATNLLSTFFQHSEQIHLNTGLNLYRFNIRDLYLLKLTSLNEITVLAMMYKWKFQRKEY